MTNATARRPRSSTPLITGLSVAVLALSLGACTRSLVGMAPTKAAGSSGQSSATAAGSKTAGQGGAATGSADAGARSGPGSTGSSDPTVKATNDSGAEVTALSADGANASGADGSGADSGGAGGTGAAGGRSAGGAAAAGGGGAAAGGAGAGGSNAAGAAGGAKGAAGSTSAGSSAAGGGNKSGAGSTAAGSSAAGAGGAGAGGAAGGARKGAGGGDTDVAAAKGGGGAGGAGATGAAGGGAAAGGTGAGAAGAGGAAQETAAERAQRERDEAQAALDAERRGRVETAANRVVIDQDEKLQTLGGTLPATFNMDEKGQFEFDKYELNDDVKVKLDEIWDKLKEAPYDRLIVHGYTDRIGTEEYNQQLSEKRAWAVAGYLMDKGVPPYKLTVVGRGKAAPLTTPDECKGLKRDALIDCLQRDRRVEVVATLKEYNLKVQ